MEAEDAGLTRYKSEQALKAAASWFWWIGVLSILNSTLSTSGKQFTFTFGLGLSQIGDAMMTNGSPIIETLGFFVTFGFAGLFLLLGWLAKHWNPAFIVGLVVYALDALIYVVAQDWIGVGVHVFASVLIIGGYRTYRRLSATASASVPSESPQPAPVNTPAS